ncbi:MAG: ABC transporter permease [Bacilli bacterium]|nr:ABC transporter permease [Bacilli bacterium]MDD7315419.1 ABC transporter permease [Bacilli bacterium]MDY4052585.1 ABC transporter permease [Bacilli bacterium]
MFKYIIKRLLISVVILLGVSVIIYSLVRMMPDDYVDKKYAEQLNQGSITQEDIDRFKELYGLSDNSFKGIIKGYFKWLGKLCKGDLGQSFKYEKPVATVISENMWISFAIAIIATILQFLIAIPLGISSATHQYSVRDYAVTVFTMIGISLPTYFFAAIVIKIFSVDLGWLPSGGLISATKDYGTDFVGQMSKFGDILKHLILPIFVSVILSIGGLMRYTRTNTLEVLNADYIRTARAKGLSENKVIYKHAFRNTMIPLVTLLAGILPSLFGGMMITEEVFSIDGIGRLAYSALMEGDIPFVMGYNMFLAVLTVIGTLLSDIMYSVVDPRVKLGK